MNKHIQDTDAHMHNGCDYSIETLMLPATWHLNPTYLADIPPIYPRLSIMAWW